MTLVILTKSHGEIDSGFYEAFMKLSRIGEYAFETKDLCGLAQKLAEEPFLKRAKIFGYPSEKFWQLERGYNSLFFLKRVSSIVDDDDEEIASFVKENRELSAGEKLELIEDKIPVDVTVSKKKGSVNIGEYEIGNPQFLAMIYYIIKGGFDGWAGEVPDFVKSVKLAIEISKNPLYRKKHS